MATKYLYNTTIFIIVCLYVQFRLVAQHKLETFWDRARLEISQQIISKLKQVESY